MQWPPPAGALGAIIAIIVIVLAVVLMVVRGPSVELGLIAALGVARLT